MQNQQKKMKKCKKKKKKKKLFGIYSIISFMIANDVFGNQQWDFCKTDWKNWTLSDLQCTYSKGRKKKERKNEEKNNEKI